MTELLHLFSRIITSRWSVGLRQISLILKFLSNYSVFLQRSACLPQNQTKLIVKSTKIEAK